MRDNTKNKRQYTKPVLERMDVDSEISMFTYSSVSGNNKGQSSTGKTYKLSSKSNGSILKSTSADQVFGGNSVDYDE